MKSYAEHEADKMGLKVATTPMDISFFEPMAHLSHVKQMCSQPMHLTHELILYVQITLGRVDFNGDSIVKSSCWHQVLNL